MNVFFGRSTIQDQYDNGFYQTDRPEMFDLINIGDYCYMIAASKIRLWKAKEWKEKGVHLIFDIIIDDLNIPIKAFTALKFFELNTHLIIYPIRQAKNKAFFKLKLIENIRKETLEDQKTYQDKRNYRQITCLTNEQAIVSDSHSLQLYKKNGKWNIFKNASFWGSDRAFDSFHDNTDKIGKRKLKDKTLTKFKNLTTLPISYNSNELSILDLYDAFAVSYYGNTKLTDDESGMEEDVIIDEPLTNRNKKDMSLNQILYGPPGTGKTYNTINKALEIIGYDISNKDRTTIKKAFDDYVKIGQIVFTTFHQSMNYEDFIEGIKPKTENQQVTYAIEDGIFKQIANKAKLESIPSKSYVLVIDEINRGNVSKIFGELITLIEESKRLGNDEALEITLPYSKEKFGVPSNLYIIGTMNTADRSVEALDTALRRRFVFEEMMPKPELLETVEGINLVNLLKTINERIAILLSRDSLIGHSYFLNVKSLEDLQATFYNNIIPLLQEYFYGDYGKIGLVLGKGFVDFEQKGDLQQDKFKKLFAAFEYDEIESLQKKVYRIIPKKDCKIKTALETLLNESKKTNTDVPAE